MKENAYDEDRLQTQVKHKLLDRYLSAAVPIIGSWAAEICYVDCLAGPWNETSSDLSDTSFSVALNVLRKTRNTLLQRGKSPSMRCIFNEWEDVPFEKLSAFCRTVADIEVDPRNWDFERHVKDVVKLATNRTKSFPFFFIDPTGWELASVPLIKPILQISPGEVLINLMTSWIRRFLSDEKKDFVRLLGEDAKRIAQLSGDEQEEELVRCYSEAVRKAGNFPYVCTMPILKSKQESFHFHMVYATRHPTGVKEFKKAEGDVVPFMHEVRAEARHQREFQATGQYSFLEPLDTYSDRRYARYHRRNLEQASQAALELLSSSEVVQFDDLWAKWMQFACVKDDELQSWMRDREKRGLLKIDNLSGRAKKLSFGNGITLTSAGAPISHD
ncbi:three-Cys-motif partner protein TcmP [Alloacidobacterium dinghuense]|uniref:Three-Cys-motif partner protein TcmP n=1 Tax=Alloacidobacterium dinghuense TaxID=2763107 RepID=A0A7G8BL90_9BACT|nr:three-Cys-motif partner protein TcmP [Alloacidobacterium dinghuense]QNI33310.1 three-Cys-motif partner protein TcmP [Alloacidobacterium dinghuense]